MGLVRINHSCLLQYPNMKPRDLFPLHSIRFYKHRQILQSFQFVSRKSFPCANNKMDLAFEISMFLKVLCPNQNNPKVLWVNSLARWQQKQGFTAHQGFRQGLLQCRMHFCLKIWMCNTELIIKFQVVFMIVHAFKRIFIVLTLNLFFCTLIFLAHVS